MNEDDGMDPGVYGDGPKKPAGSVDDQEQEQGTDLMNKASFPGGCAVGDKYEVEIVADHGDQFEVKVMKPEDKEQTPEAGGEGSGDPELAEMDKNY